MPATPPAADPLAFALDWKRDDALDLTRGPWSVEVGNGYVFRVREATAHPDRVIAVGDVWRRRRHVGDATLTVTFRVHEAR